MSFSQHTHARTQVLFAPDQVVMFPAYHEIKGAKQLADLSCNFQQPKCRSLGHNEGQSDG